MSCYKTLQIENEQLREILTDAQRGIDVLTEDLEYGPQLVAKEEIIQRLGYIDLPPTDH